MIVIIIICIVLSALFSSSETAFASVNKIRLKSMADQGDKRALKALHIAEHYEDSLTAILVGNNIVNIGASSLATVVFTQWVGSAGPAVSTVAMTILVLIFGKCSRNPMQNLMQKKWRCLWHLHFLHLPLL